jgi:hypothetical protein
MKDRSPESGRVLRIANSRSPDAVVMAALSRRLRADFCFVGSQPQSLIQINMSSGLSKRIRRRLWLFRAMNGLIFARRLT